VERKPNGNSRCGIRVKRGAPCGAGLARHLPSRTKCNAERKMLPGSLNRLSSICDNLLVKNPLNRNSIVNIRSTPLLGIKRSGR
jgi:hypothetical protein